MDPGIDLSARLGNPESMQIGAFIFDVFGTLVDWRSSISAAAAQRFAAVGATMDPDAFADAWRGEYQPAMERIRSEGRSYVPLDRLHRENLEQVLDRFGLKDSNPHFNDDAYLSDWARDWERLDPWPDVVGGLRALRQHGRVAPCSNGSIALMSHLARHAGFHWDAILGADIARDYKPKAEVYLASAAALGLAPDEVMMVAAHEDDLASAQAAGLKTAYIPRPLEFGAPRDAAPTGDWTLNCRDIPDIAGTFDAMNS